MASTVLPNGIIIPEKYSRDWYADLYHNWQELDNLLGGGTPKDGTLTIQKNGDTVGTFSANQSTNETINITVPTVNDATLTIQKNGTTVDTFTANSSTDKTVNIAIPTKTSDLTNDSGFITEDNTKIPLAGSNAIYGSLIPATTDAYDLGGSSYQWNNAYIKSLTINGAVCGDILTHNMSEFVDVSSNQTIGGVKSFKDTIVRNVGNFTAGEAPTAQTTCFVLKHTNNDGTSNANSIISYMFTTGESMCELTQNPCIGSTARTWFRTNTDGTYSIYSYTKNGALGTPSYKWKDVQTEKINGINPGALSLPNPSNTILLDTTNWDLTNYTVNNYTPPADGWIMLGGYADVIQIDGSMNYGITVNKGYDGYCEAFLPVLKNCGVRCRFKNCTILNNAKFYPCQGNV